MFDELKFLLLVIGVSLIVAGLFIVAQNADENQCKLNARPNATHWTQQAYTGEDVRIVPRQNHSSGFDVFVARTNTSATIFCSCDPRASCRLYLDD